MKILSPGDLFICEECGLTGCANLPTDYHLTICNGTKIYSIVCPCCGKATEVPEGSIPSHLLKYIKPVRGSLHIR